MKYIIIYIIIGIGICVSLWIVGMIVGISDTIANLSKSSQPQTLAQVLVTACPSATTTVVNEVDNVVDENGWTCQPPEESDTLLQPNGVWALSFNNCQKLIEPIWQWCADHPQAECTDAQKKRP